MTDPYLFYSKYVNAGVANIASGNVSSNKWGEYFKQLIKGWLSIAELSKQTEKNKWWLI